MERKVNYTAVGAFVIVFVLAINVFVLWISRTSLRVSSIPYNIYFAGSITGLQVGSAVRYRGVPSGTVKEIKIDPENLEQVRVTIHVERDIPVKEDTFASLETIGITGITYIQLNGGSKHSKSLRYDGVHPPIIPARASRLEEVVSSVPDVLRQASSLIQELRGIFTEENRAALGDILKNIDTLTASFVSDGEKGPTLGEALRDTAVQLRKSLKSLQGVAGGLEGILDDNSTNLSRLMNKAFETLDTFDRIGKALENSPARFLTNDPQQGVRTP